MWKFLQKGLEITGAIQIALSPIIIAIVTGGIIYLARPSAANLIVSSLIVLTGLATGIWWARRIYKSKKGAIGYMSKVSNSPELDNQE
ncbi:MAG TPA: hypothetical protein PLM81_06355 [Ginsengibacter sp.]|nr:hypothetical protein [Ginsengibacter sp.]HRP44771.1 hypothetical protein [Ginsengibacter sp.]